MSARLLELPDRFYEAMTFAAEAHEGQYIPGTRLPYLTHVVAVAMEVLAAHAQQPISKVELAVTAALLHDVLEDTATPEDEVRWRFGDAVADGVRALTKRHDLAKPEAMADSLARIREQPGEIWMVKVADRVTNLRPPPAHWSREKCAAYHREAETILVALGDAHPVLRARLVDRLESYRAFL